VDKLELTNIGKNMDDEGAATLLNKLFDELRHAAAQVCT
jgi:hypothetical protein